VTNTLAIFNHPFSTSVPRALRVAAQRANWQVREVQVDTVEVAAHRSGMIVSDAHGPIRVDACGPLLAYWYPTALLALEVLEQQGVRVLNPGSAIRIADDKSLTATALAHAGVPQPTTSVVAPDRVLHTLDARGLPSILKLPFGAQGRWVRLVRHTSEAKAAIEEFEREDAHSPVLVQEFREAWFGTSVRVICLNGEVLAATRRSGPPGQLVSNVGAGGEQVPLDLDSHHSEMALAAASAVGLRFSGVDLLIDGQHGVVLEVNSHPDFTSMGDSVVHAVTEAIVAALRA
jgi:RimK family alpha-L-glutamate ligase